MSASLRMKGKVIVIRDGMCMALIPLLVAIGSDTHHPHSIECAKTCAFVYLIALAVTFPLSLLAHRRPAWSAPVVTPVA